MLNAVSRDGRIYFVVVDSVAPKSSSREKYVPSIFDSDVKRSQNLEAEDEAEARATRPRPRPISGG